MQASTTANAPRIAALLEARNIRQQYGPDGRGVLVLDDVSFVLRENDFVALLGQSGSGKSTLLRIVTGLSRPSAGEVLYRGERLDGVNPHAAIVFQSFALYPWFTAAENVEVALKAKGVPASRRREMAESLLDLVGLDGFEDAYPRELSGGMRQKVGFARALGVEPEMLCLDEPFSALDVLSAETLRGELLELWLGKKLPIRAILMVTHNIEEAVLLANRVIVLSRNPGRVIDDFAIPLPYPRSRESRVFSAIVDRIYRLITLAPTAPLEAGLALPLPRTSIESIAGLTEVIAAGGGRADLYRLASDLQMDADDLLLVTSAAELLGLGRVEQADFIASPLGLEFADADVLRRKELLQSRVRELPLVRRIMNALASAPDHRVPEEELLGELEEHFSPGEARSDMETAIDWGRYAELFSYDHDTRELMMEE